MDVLFLIGAVVIGASARFWRAVAIAGVQIVVLVISIVERIIGVTTPAVLLVGFAAYLFCIGVGFATYVQGLSLAKDHPRRETCELLGASSSFGAVGVIAGVILAFA